MLSLIFPAFSALFGSFFILSGFYTLIQIIYNRLILKNKKPIKDIIKDM